MLPQQVNHFLSALLEWFHSFPNGMKMEFAKEESRTLLIQNLQEDLLLEIEKIEEIKGHMMAANSSS